MSIRVGLPRLRQTLAKTKQVLIDLQKQRGPVAAELKKGFEDAWDAIEKAFARARQKVREQESSAPGEPGPPHQLGQ